MNCFSACVTAFFIVASVCPSAIAQGRPDPEKLMESQREALRKFSWLDGTWRGTAWTALPNGERLELTQTERIGPLLSGSVKVIEGRGYDKAGKTVFNALGVVSYNVASGTFNMHSNADGRSGNYVLTPTADGYYWEVPSGPVSVRYTAVFKDGVWKEVGDLTMPGRPSQRIFEMTLTRISDSAWPAAGAVSPN